MCAFLIAETRRSRNAAGALIERTGAYSQDVRMWAVRVLIVGRCGIPPHSGDPRQRTPSTAGCPVEPASQSPTRLRPDAL